jgi:hypothetical protein
MIGQSRYGLSLRTVGVTALVLAFATLCAVTTLAEVLMAATLWWPLVLIVWIAGTGILFGASLLSSGKWWRLASIGLLGALLVLRVVSLNPVKPFRRFYYALKPGMSKSEVRSLLRAHFEQQHRFPIPVEWDNPATRNPSYTSYTLDPKKANYNSEIVIIGFAEDRLTTKDYLPD